MSILALPCAGFHRCNSQGLNSTRFFPSNSYHCKEMKVLSQNPGSLPKPLNISWRSGIFGRSANVSAWWTRASLTIWYPLTTTNVRLPNCTLKMFPYWPVSWKRAHCPLRTRRWGFSKLTRPRPWTGKSDFEFDPAWSKGTWEKPKPKRAGPIQSQLLHEGWRRRKKGWRAVVWERWIASICYLVWSGLDQVFTSVWLVTRM